MYFLLLMNNNILFDVFIVIDVNVIMILFIFI